MNYMSADSEESKSNTVSIFDYKKWDIIPESAKKKQKEFNEKAERKRQNDAVKIHYKLGKKGPKP